MTVVKVQARKRTSNHGFTDYAEVGVRVRPYYPDLVEVKHGRAQLILTHAAAVALADALVDSSEAAEAQEENH